VALPESGETGGEITGASPADPGQTGQSQVPYVEVYQEYADAYRQAIESGQVPGAFRDLVREYFSSLEP
jgi:hypothetical protein